MNAYLYGFYSGRKRHHLTFTHNTFSESAIILLNHSYPWNMKQHSVEFIIYLLFENRYYTYGTLYDKREKKKKKCYEKTLGKDWDALFGMAVTNTGRLLFRGSGFKPRCGLNHTFLTPPLTHFGTLLETCCQNWKLWTSRFLLVCTLTTLA